MPRRSRRKILGKRPEYDHLQREEDMRELERELRRLRRQRQAEDDANVQADSTDAGQSADD